MIKFGKGVSVITGIAGCFVMAGAEGASFVNVPILDVAAGLVIGLALLMGGVSFYLMLDSIEYIRSQKRGKTYRKILYGGHMENKKSA